MTATRRRTKSSASGHRSRSGSRIGPLEFDRDTSAALRIACAGETSPERAQHVGLSTASERPLDLAAITPVCLLRCACATHWPGKRRGTDKRDEFAPLHVWPSSCSFGQRR